MKILIIGAVPQTEDEITFYGRLKNILEASGDVIYTPIETMKSTLNEKDRFDKAINLVSEADLIVAECSKASSGQGIEIGYAYSKDKDIIAIAKKECNVSGLIKGCPNVKDIMFYEDVDELEDKLKW